MKKITLLFSLLALTFSMAWAQQIVNNPRLSASTASKIIIDRISISDTSTVFDFTSYYPPGTWFRFSPATYIIGSKDKEKLKVKSAAGITLGKESYTAADGKASFSMTFPPLKTKSGTVDLIECEEDGCFKYLDIQLNESKEQSVIPEALVGNWFNADGSKQWELSLLTDKALYDSKVWSYGTLKISGKQMTLSLANGKEKKILYLEKGNDGTYKVWEKPDRKLSIAKNESEKAGHKPDSRGYGASIFKRDSATYMGYFKGYSPKLGYRTGQVYVDNILSSEQESYLVNINPDGTFKIKILMNHPEGVFVRFPGYNETVYLEPGKTVFQMVDLSNDQKKPLYMGEVATLNREMQELTPKFQLNYEEMVKNSREMSPEEFKAHYDKIEQQQLAELNKLHLEHPMSKKAFQLSELEIKYRVANAKMDYSRHNEQDAQKDPTAKSKAVGASFYGFVKSLPINNPLSLVSNSYNSLINRIKYSDFLYTQNPEENSVKAEQTMRLMLERGDVEAKDLQFVTDYINREKGPDTAKSLADFNAKYGTDKITAFINSNEVAFSSVANDIFRMRRNKKLKAAYGLENALAANVMKSQDYARELKQNFIPLTPKKLAQIQLDLSDPFMYNSIVFANEDLKQKILVNKSKTGYVVNEVDKSSTDSLFTTIMKKFKGKPVYLDFWATWCGPCRSGIQQIAPLKEEMANDNIAFVYITNPSSPLETYKNMIADIKGEHFRLTNDEWNILSNKFKISGIPHYVLIDKEGKVVDPHLPHLGNNEIKKRLKELMN